jgi:hypothetical protein
MVEMKDDTQWIPPEDSPNGLLNASSLEKPVISAVFSFHSFTLPFTSIPKTIYYQCKN